MPMITAQDLRSQDTTSGRALDFALTPLTDLVARAEAAYAASHDGDAWREYLAAARELEDRVDELLYEFVPRLFAALDSGDSRAVLRAVAEFRRLPACVRRFIFAVHGDALFFNNITGDDVTPAAYVDAAIARRARLAEGRETR